MQQYISWNNYMKPLDVKSSIYIDSSKETNDEYPKFKIGDIVGISKYKNFFPQGNVPNLKEFSKKVKNTVP